MKRDFKSLRTELLGRARGLLQEWFPEGRFNGAEFKIGSISGEKGDSLSINWQTGVWSDFANGEKGSDLIALYAAKAGCSMSEAYDAITGPAYVPPSVTPAPVVPKRATLGIPPANNNKPTLFVHRTYGPPSTVWTYRTEDGRPIGYVARHDQPGHRKQFIPWFYDTEKNAWVNQMIDTDRPLYGLDLLHRNPDKPVLVVEGEKAADAAKVLASQHYVVVTWPGGAQALRKVDWSPVYGRKIFLWPDNDEPGLQCMRLLAEMLSDRVAEIKMLNPDGQAEKWDAADAVNAGWTWDALRTWAKNKITLWEPATTEQKKVSKAVAKDNSIKGMQELWETLGLEIGGSMRPHPNLDNLCRVLEAYEPLMGIVWYDEFREKILTSWDSDVREWTDADDLKLTRLMQSQLGIPKCSAQTVHDAVVLVAQARIRNEVKDWLDRLHWDGESRLRLLLSEGFGTPQDEYHAMVGQCWIISMVARIYRPGCKVDTMPIFEGSQGAGKSSALRILGGAWFTECHENVTSKDFYGVLKGAWLVEISEMHSFNKTEVERIKGVISCQVDRYRAPYGRNAEDHPRRSVFAGTTNRTDWNRDETGARRFWAVACGNLDLEFLAAAREQLFAEAVALFKRGTPWWDVPAEEAAAQAELRRPEDTWEDVLRNNLEEDRSYTTLDLLCGPLGVEVSKQDRRMQVRLAAAMRALKWEYIVTKSFDRKSIRVWKKYHKR